jgi:hypothetical protein
MEYTGYPTDLGDIQLLLLEINLAVLGTLETLASASFPEPWKARFLSLEEILVSGVQIPRCHLQGLGVDLAKPGVGFLENTFDSLVAFEAGEGLPSPPVGLDPHLQKLVVNKAHTAECPGQTLNLRRFGI